VRIHPHAIARGAAKQFVHRNAERLPLDIPERLIDSAERARQDRAAAIKRVAVNRLSMLAYRPGIFADQIGLNLFDRLGAG
jgi:hypothetical protein